MTGALASLPALSASGSAALKLVGALNQIVVLVLLALKLLDSVGLQLVVLFQLRQQLLVVAVRVDDAYHDRRDRADDGADYRFPHRLHLPVQRP